MRPFYNGPGQEPSVEALYLRCPTPEYRQAFDLAVARLSRAQGPLLAVLSSPAHATEMLKRCSRPLDFAATDAFDAHKFVAEAQPWAWGPARAVSLDKTDESYTAILWAEPEQSVADELAASLGCRAAAGATLAVIASSALRRHLPDWQTVPPPAFNPLPTGGACRCLRRASWQIVEMIAFHGPRSLIWSRLGRLAAAFGRPDWDDRCQHAMRTRYREAGWLWPLAPLALILARRA